MTKETGEVTSIGFVNGQKLYQKRALKALPLIVRQAKAGQTIYYSELAREMGMPNERNLNYVLGAIGGELKKLGKEWKQDIPPLQCVVINKAHSIPGEGIGWFVDDPAKFRKSSRDYQRKIIDLMLARVFEFRSWDKVLQHFGLRPTAAPVKKLPAVPSAKTGHYGQGGESLAHKNLKELIASNPKCIGLREANGKGVTEYEFASSDTIDVLFNAREDWIGVEVKAHDSPDTEVIRGMFQCVKYKALIEATQRANQIRMSARVLLALGGPLPVHLLELKNVLGVEVIEHVHLAQAAAR